MTDIPGLSPFSTLRQTIWTIEEIRKRLLDLEARVTVLEAGAGVTTTVTTTVISSVTVTITVTAPEPIMGTIVEPILLADTLSVTMSMLNAVTETMTMDMSLSSAMTMPSSFAESVSLSDTISVTVSVLAFYVSTTGSDSAAGTIAAPFKTLTKARNEMRLSATTKRTRLRAGTFRLSSPLVLNSQDNNTIWEAQPGEAVKLTNAVSVTVTQTTTGIWQSVVANWEDVWVVFAGGQRQIPNRYPAYDAAEPLKGGWLYSDDAAATAFPTRTCMVKAVDRAALPASVQTPTGRFRRVICFSGQFSFFWGGLQSYNSLSGTLVADWGGTENVANGNRFYVERIGTAPADLQQDGSWLHTQESTGFIYLRKSGYGGADIEAVRSDAFAAVSIVDLTGSSISDVISGVTIRDIEFYGQWGPDDFTNQGRNLRGAIRMQYANNCLVQACRFHDVSHAVVIADGTNCKVRGNWVHDTFQHSIHVGGSHTGFDIRGNLVEDSPIHIRNGSAIHVDGSASNGTIAYNTVRDNNGFGIVANGSNLTIEYNNVSNIALQHSDDGAIYGFGASASSNTVQFNFIEPSVGLKTSLSTTGTANYSSDPWVWDVYTDENTSNWTIQNNVMKGTAKGSYLAHLCGFHALTNNIMLDGDGADHLVNIATNNGLRLTRNILRYAAVPTDGVIRRDTASMSYSVDSNHYDAGADSATAFPEGSLSAHRVAAYVVNTTVGTISFVNTTSNDYTVVNPPVGWTSVPKKSETGTPAYTGEKWTGL